MEEDTQASPVPDGRGRVRPQHGPLEVTVPRVSRRKVVVRVVLRVVLVVVDNCLLVLLGDGGVHGQEGQPLFAATVRLGRRRPVDDLVPVGRVLVLADAAEEERLLPPQTAALLLLAHLRVEVSAPAPADRKERKLI